MFGLRKYEAAIYVSLTTMGTSTALELSRRASIPLPRIYTSIKSLETRGYLNRLPGTPSRYRATHPGHILRAEMALLRKKIESILLEVEQEYETSISRDASVQPGAGLMYGARGMIASIIGMLQSTQVELVGMLEDVSWCSEEEILLLLKELKKRKLKIMLVGRNNHDSTEDLRIFRAASGGSVRLLPPEELKASFLIKDKTDIMMMVNNDSQVGHETVSTVLITEPMISQMIHDLFQDVWNRASRLGGIDNGE